VVYLIGDPVKGPILWSPLVAAADGAMLDVDVFYTLVIFVVLDKECESCRVLSDFPR